MKITLSGLLLLMSVVLLGCAGPENMVLPSSQLLGDAELQADILGMIALREVGAGASGEPQVVGARILHSDGDCAVQEWIVDRNGEVVYYPVLLVSDSDPTTGTTFAVMRPKNQPMDSTEAAHLAETMGALLRPN